MEQYTWVPCVARAVYGDAAAFNLPRQSYVDDPPSLERAVFLEWKDGEGLPAHRARAGARRALSSG